MYPGEQVTRLFSGQSGTHHGSLLRNRRGAGEAIGASGGEADVGGATQGAVGECGAEDRGDRECETRSRGVRRDARWRRGTRGGGNRAAVGKTGHSLCERGVWSYRGAEKTFAGGLSAA